MLPFLYSKLTSLLALYTFLVSFVDSQTGTNLDPVKENDYNKLGSIFPKSPVDNLNHGSSIVIVSTLDGKVSALDTQDGGRLVWSVDIGKGPLLSSSISKLQVKQDGKFIRLIPSLSGGLFQFDGKSVEAVPFNADHLLSSSFKVADDSLLVGGKDVTTFGLESTTGKVLYLCSVHGCERFSDSAPGSDVIIVKRRQQTVRSVGNRNGQEKWNFTVGEVELEISKGTSYKLLEHSGDGEYESDHKEDEMGGETHKKYPKEDCQSASKFIGKIEVMVPEGIFCLFKAQAKKALNWKYKFSSPIANAWYVTQGEQYKINLFDPKNVPALEHRGSQGSMLIDPTIYMGFYKSQVYIQASQATEEAVENAVASNALLPLNPYIQNLKFPYRPYLATTNQLTEAVVGESSDGEVAVYAESSADGSCGNSLAIYAEDKTSQEGSGYYFKSDSSYHGSFRESRRKGRNTVEDGANDSFKDYHIDVVYSSFMHWWKEILIISVTTSIFMQMLIVKVMQIYKKDQVEVSRTNSAEYIQALEEVDRPKVDVVVPFQSRYLNDFEPVRCLGKGGFGVVFESRNIVDDCSYAVKRIRLPNKQSAREKVMREVRALAKLDHPCIVRYFNAWTEEPPQGWQERTDQQLMTDISSFARSASSLPSSSLLKKETDDTGPTHDDMTHKTNNYPTFGGTGSFSIGPVHPGVGNNESSSIIFRESTASENEKKIVPEDERPHLGKFFQTSSTSDDEECCADISLNQSVPFRRYQDFTSIVFEDNDKSEHFGSSADSAIDVHNNGARSCVKGHKRSVSDCAELPTYEQIYGRGGALSSGVRKRSVSVKQTADEDSDTTGSELRAVVCKKNSSSEKEGQKNNCKPTLGSSVFLYIQMQLCRKDSLRVWLANNTKNRNHHDCLWIFQQTLSAVEYVHSESLIHRDLKPSNIFFSIDGNIKVGDFGLVTNMDDNVLSENAAAYDENVTLDTNDNASHTERVGTRLYMAPEQMNSRNYSQKVDIYALGLILFELLTPFSTQMERVREMTQARNRKIRDEFTKLYPTETELVKQMLSAKASERPTAEELSRHVVFDTFDPLDPTMQRSKFWSRIRTSSK